MRGKPAIFPIYGFLPEGLPSLVGFADSFPKGEAFITVG